ncbi:ras-GEF domain-containing family member 1B [Nilaparvata lugens]|uniref:ras-GEF domain-containing family member 1B n=1 Tax=Nilaparvata lugens TaxID=108931 RepID=UPI00193DF9AF|nr:ras-GEF domain-containing family member 1B [Nilaparvata lugens]
MPPPGGQVLHERGSSPEVSPTEPEPPAPIATAPLPADPALQKTAAEGNASEPEKQEEEKKVDPCAGTSEVDYREGRLVSGTVQVLVQLLVEDSLDDSFFFAFILCARLFVKPHDLLGDVISLGESLADNTLPSNKERLASWLPRIIELLRRWTQQFPYDFRDDRVMAYVRGVTHRCVLLEADVSDILQRLLDRLQRLEKHEERLRRLALENVTVDVLEVCGESQVLAEQLTVLEMERLSFIGSEEFVQAFLQDHQRLDTKCTNNLENYVAWFDRLSYFVATHISQQTKSKGRAKALHLWIEVARHCLQINNFNSLMAILAGVNLPPIARLKKTWSRVDRQELVILEAAMGPSSQFSGYRSLLQDAVQSPPQLLVPFFSLFVKDAYFLIEECSQQLPNGHIRFESFEKLSNQLLQFTRWKTTECPYHRIDSLAFLMEAGCVFSETELYLASFEIEPPEIEHEIESYKIYKSRMS